MNKEELEQLFKTDSEYKEKITECEEWIQEFKNDTPDDKKASVAAKYIKQVIGLLTSFEEVLTGNYKDDELKEEFAPKKGEDFNLDSIDFMQTTLFSIHYRIALVNREAHVIINPSIDFTKVDSPLEEVIELIMMGNQSEIYVRGYVPQYVYDLELNTELNTK